MQKDRINSALHLHTGDNHKPSGLVSVQHLKLHDDLEDEYPPGYDNNNIPFYSKPQKAAIYKYSSAKRAHKENMN